MNTNSNNKNSSEEETKKSKKRMRRGFKIEEDDSDSSKNKNKIENNKRKIFTKQKTVPNNDTKTSELQSKLKKIFAVREMGKYEYNKQEIPEYLKYHSDDSESSEISGFKKSIMSKKEDQMLKQNNEINFNNTTRNLPAPNPIKRQNSDKSSNRISVKGAQKLRKSKENLENISIYSKNKKINNDEISETKSKKINNNDNENNNNNNSKNKFSDSKYLKNDSNKKDNKNIVENEIEKKPKKNNVRDLIAKLKAKKNEKEELERQEKEAEEQSIMRGKIERKQEKEEINDSEIEKEAEKLRQKEKRIEERRLAREKRRKQEEEERRKKEYEREEEKRKKEEEKRKEEERKKIEEEKRKKEEEEEEERRKEEEKREEERKKIETKDIRINKHRGSKKYISNENIDAIIPKKIYREDSSDITNLGITNIIPKNERRPRKKTEIADNNNKIINKLKIENNNNDKIKPEDPKKEIIITEITNTKLNRSFESGKNNNNLTAYKKPIKKYTNKNATIYKPKKPGGGILKGRSQEKIKKTINKIDNNNNLYVQSNKKINNQITCFRKKSPIGGNFCKLNKSFGEYRNTNLDNGGFIMKNKYNVNTLELSSLPDLNSSYDSRLINFGNNFQFGLNNDFYARTAQKDYNPNTNNSMNSPIINNNAFPNMNNYFRINSMNNINNMNNLSNLNNLNTLNYLNNENENNYFNMSNQNINNNNSSFYDIRQAQISPYDLSSSYNYGYNNPIANFPSNTPVGINPNLLGNNFLGLNNSFNRGISGIQNFNNNGNNFMNIFNKSSISSSINIEDLLVLEEKLNEITIALNKVKFMHNECFDFWNFYYNFSSYGNLEKFFSNVIESKNVQISINYILMSILICYDCSYEIEVLNNVYSMLKDLLNLNHKNLMLIYEHILTIISNDSLENIWVIKLLNIVNSSKNSDFNDDNSMNGYSMNLIEKINFNTGIIIQNIRVLLKNYKTPRVEYLTSLFKKINDKTYDDINNFFRQYILREDNLNGSILGSVYLKNNPEFETEPAPYIRTKNQKNFSLVLGLDETLVHFKMNPENENEGVLKVRPGVMEFLDSVTKFYELIIFTNATQDYANLLIDNIEENKIYFVHRLYRQHTMIKDNDFVKDLSRIGRPLDKIIIVDSMPQNFRLQKENGINIKAFWGEDIYDSALIDLAPILINIAKEGGDLRKGLKKYRNEIVEKVTSNISKHNI